MVRVLLLVAAAFLSLAPSAYGKASGPETTVADPFLELHTGPGAGFPVFHVVDRGEKVKILKRRTDWFKVSDSRGKSGWVPIEQMLKTLDAAGAPVSIPDPGSADFAARRWESGVEIGDFDGASVIGVYGGYHFTRNLAVEIWGSDLSGDFSDGWMTHVDVVHQPFPEWRVSPFFALGTGLIHIQPQATLVQTPDRTDQVGHVGIGLRTHLGKRFVIRAEYSSYLVFTSRDDNEEIDEWKAGLAIFF
jgi:Bacterial SH3 domain